MTAGFADLVRAALAAGRPARVPVTGTSMAPVLTGGAVLVEPADFDRLRPGEVVAYRHGERIVVHRVVAHRRDHLLTAGDNLPLYDPPVPRDAVLGRVPHVPPRAADAPAVPLGPLPATTIWLTGAAASAYDRFAGAHPVRIRRVASVPRDLAGLTVGISAAAVRPVEDLRTGLVGRHLPAGPVRRLDVVVGCRFGQPAADDPTVVVPDAVDHHLRAGPPLAATSPEHEIRAVLAVLGIPAAQPAGAS